MYHSPPGLSASSSIGRGGGAWGFMPWGGRALELLRQRGRVTYNALKRQFGLDDACLQDLKDEIIEAQRVAVDEDGRVLVWTGDVGGTPPPASAPAAVQVRPPDAGPQAYTPAHLAEKIVTARPALAR